MDDPRFSAPPPPRHIRPPQPPSRGTEAHSFPALLVSSMADQRPAHQKAWEAADGKEGKAVEGAGGSCGDWAWVRTPFPRQPQGQRPGGESPENLTSREAAGEAAVGEG